MSHVSETVFRLHSFTVFFMTGVIWLVQLVVYPQFERVSGEAFKKYYSFHTRWVTAIVVPVIVAQTVTAAILWFQRIFLEPGTPALTNFAQESTVAGMPLIFTFAVIMQTFFMEVPVHLQLRKTGQDAPLIRRLIRDNWWRTLTWSAHAVWLLVI